MTSVLVHDSEVALKGKNRSWSVGRLVRHIHGALAGLHVKEVRTPIGRIEIVLGQDAALPASPIASSARRPESVACPPAPVAASWRCCPAALTHLRPPGG